jgi:hypothetical protein
MIGYGPLTLNNIVKFVHSFGNIMEMTNVETKSKAAETWEPW